MITAHVIPEARDGLLMPSVAALSRSDKGKFSKVDMSDEQRSETSVIVRVRNFIFSSDIPAKKSSEGHNHNVRVGGTRGFLRLRIQLQLYTEDRRRTKAQSKLEPAVSGRLARPGVIDNIEL